MGGWPGGPNSPPWPTFDFTAPINSGRSAGPLPSGGANTLVTGELSLATPSARLLPSAVSSKVAHGPFLDRNCPRLGPQKRSLLVIQLGPPTIAVSQSPAHREVQAIWGAAAPNEHAVSMLRLGPLNSK